MLTKFSKQKWHTYFAVVGYSHWLLTLVDVSLLKYEFRLSLSVSLKSIQYQSLRIYFVRSDQVVRATTLLSCRYLPKAKPTLDLDHSFIRRFCQPPYCTDPLLSLLG